MNFRLIGKKGVNLALSLTLLAGVAISAVHLPQAEASTQRILDLRYHPRQRPR